MSAPKEKQNVTSESGIAALTESRESRKTTKQQGGGHRLRRSKSAGTLDNSAFGDAVEFEGVDAVDAGLLLIVIVVERCMQVVALALVLNGTGRRCNSREAIAYTKEGEDGVAV